MKRVLLFLLLFVLLVVIAAGSLGVDLGSAPWADVSAEELQSIYHRFEHARHARALAREDLGCTACHVVGGVIPPKASYEKADKAYLTPPEGACHYCHNPPGGGRSHGPRNCYLCHDAEMRPASHGAAWLSEHGVEARLEGDACYDCHRRSFCVDCHARKDTSRYRVHNRNWLSIHGIAAETDPAGCGTCHLQAECLACHSRSKDPAR
jgi:hypothetical protein